MKKRHIVALVLLLLALPLFFGVYELGLKKVLKPAHENIEREVFENTKSYLHGVQQDLGKYYLEYQKADADERTAIKATILMRFAEVDESKIQNSRVRTFLIETRGY